MFAANASLFGIVEPEAAFRALSEDHMTVQVVLNIVTLIMCILTLAMASAAMMPQIKQALALLRDGLLWLILVSVIGVVGAIGWSRLMQARQRTQPEEVPAVLSVLPARNDVEQRAPAIPAPTSRAPRATLAINGRPTGGLFAPNRSWPINSQASTAAK